MRVLERSGVSLWSCNQTLNDRRFGIFALQSEQEAQQHFKMPQLMSSQQEYVLRKQAWKLCFQETQTTHISTIPLRVATIFACGETASVEEQNAAERCCCRDCADKFIASGKLSVSIACDFCGRCGCLKCLVQRADGRSMCNSRICLLSSRLHDGSCNIQDFCVESDQLSRVLMQQWLVLQFKQERELGSLRAYFLVQCRSAANLCQLAERLLTSCQIPALQKVNDEYGSSDNLCRFKAHREIERRNM